MTERRRGRRVLLVGAAMLSGVMVASAAALALTGRQLQEVPRTAPQRAVAPIVRTTLLEHKTVQGTLGYAGRRDVLAAGTGRLTWRPTAGRVLDIGKRVYQVDGVDVVLLYGDVPAYRVLKEGLKGKDVRELETSLSILGYTGFTVDDTYSKATADAVRRWQGDRKLKKTGTVDPATIWFTPGPVRVESRKTTPGQSVTPGMPVLSVTSSRRVVIVPLKVDDYRLARKGTRVTVTLPDGRTVKGSVTQIGSTVKDSQEGSGEKQSTVDVTVSVPGSVRRFERAPVDVTLVSDRRKDVLAVPVSALIAMPGGGYGVTLVGPGGTTRDVKVTTGMFAAGKVEVSGQGLVAGAQVEVAQ
ncbi:peptidoglycan-binding protein [Sphaerisporangium sp. NBC_01403]|uniref:peptidoglycan-binding protein n=1 Tax=Sphaerisporangium sp. NBC_01403 TaxID=2903599 RepID=UPI00324981F4